MDPYVLEEKLRYQKSKYLMIGVLVLIVAVTVTAYISRELEHQRWLEKQSEVVRDTACVVVESNDTLTLDYDCIQKLLEKHRVKFSHIVLGQIYNESANLSYRPRIRDNNLLGMKVAAQRYCFATNYWDYGNFARFKDIEDCIRDYKAWQVQNAYHISSEADYYKLLDTVYDFEDFNYSGRIKASVKVVLKQLKQNRVK